MTTAKGEASPNRRPNGSAKAKRAASPPPSLLRLLPLRRAPASRAPATCSPRSRSTKGKGTPSTRSTPSTRRRVTPRGGREDELRWLAATCPRWVDFSFQPLPGERLLEPRLQAKALPHPRHARRQEGALRQLEGHLRQCLQRQRRARGAERQGVAVAAGDAGKVRG